MTWLDTSALRIASNNSRPADEAGLQEAVDIACAKVEELCGPVLLTTVTAEIVTGSGYALALAYRAASLSSLATYPAGTALTVTDYRVDGQLLMRKDGDWITGPLSVTYSTGAASAPVWALGAAKLIAQQWLRLMRVFGPNPGAAAEGGTRDLVPMGAMHLMGDHLLAPGGFA